MADQSQPREAMRQTLRALSHSVRAGRPMSLPNLLRYHRRHCAGCTPEQLSYLRALYLRRQPFRQ